METLVVQLNNLLLSLDIPLTLEYPSDLTPSLLIAILESLLQFRLPLPKSLRRTMVGSTSESISARLQCMKIFLGVLETDILQMDIGLGKVDPRKLAAGEENAVVFVGEVLCWIGSHIGDLNRRKEGSSVGSTLHGSNDSVYDSPVHRRPRCIHEVPLPSFLFSPLSSLDESPSQLSVRYTGYIAPVDHEWEVQSFENSSKDADDISIHISVPSKTNSLELLQVEQKRTIGMLKERARLLEQLAQYQEG